MADSDASVEAGGDSGFVDEDGDTATATFSVSQLAGLVLWLDAAKGVAVQNGKVTTWADLSGRANDGTATGGPAYLGSGINKRPAVHFDYTTVQGMTIGDSTSLQWGTGDFLIAFVFRSHFPSQFGGFFWDKRVADDGGSTLALRGGFNAGKLFFDASPATLQMSTPSNDDVPRQVSLARLASGLHLRVNGFEEFASGPYAGDFTAAGIGIGTGGVNGGGMEIDFAEIVAVKGTVAQVDRDKLEAYFKAKYNL